MKVFSKNIFVTVAWSFIIENLYFPILNIRFKDLKWMFQWNLCTKILLTANIIYLYTFLLILITSNKIFYINNGNLPNYSCDFLKRSIVYLTQDCPTVPSYLKSQCCCNLFDIHTQTSRKNNQFQSLTHLSRVKQLAFNLFQQFIHNLYLV